MIWLRKAYRLRKAFSLPRQSSASSSFVFLQGGEAIHRRIEGRVHGLVVGRALALLGLEIDLAEPLHFFGQ